MRYGVESLSLVVSSSVVSAKVWSVESLSEEVDMSKSNTLTGKWVF